MRLLLVSATLLFAELLLIRWIPANVIYVGFFRNFLLMASFLGIGLGILWGAPGPASVAAFGPLLLAVAILVLPGRVSIQLSRPARSSSASTENRRRRRQLPRPAGWSALCALLMAGLAVPLGGLLKAMPPLSAYRWDIAGSLAGIAGFTLLSALGRRRSCGSSCSRSCSSLGGLAAGLSPACRSSPR